MSKFYVEKIGVHFARGFGESQEQFQKRIEHVLMSIKRAGTRQHKRLLNDLKQHDCSCNGIADVKTEMDLIVR